MKNFIFKSTDADLQKMFQQIETIQKNVLYVTHRIDFLIKKVDELLSEEKLQTQVDDFYKTSPQTDPEEHDQNDLD